MEQHQAGQGQRARGIQRYSRQLVLEGVGSTGQQAWLQSSVAILGAGPGAWLSERYLRAAGVHTAREADGEEDLLIDLRSTDRLSPLAQAAMGAEEARRALLDLLPSAAGRPREQDSTNVDPLVLEAPSVSGDPLVVVVGAGGLGCPVLVGLLCSGVRRFRIIDDDVVEWSNLPRQILHGESDLGQPKAESAAEELRTLNRELALAQTPLKIEPVTERLAPGATERLFDGADLVIEGSDNFPTKYLVNASTRTLGLPAVLGGVIRYEGQTLPLVAQKGDAACYRCLFPRSPAVGAVPTCSTAGVLGPVAAAVGLRQVALGLQLLAGHLEIGGRLGLYEGRRGEWSELIAPVRADCIGCGPEADDPTLRGAAEGGSGRCSG